MIEWIDVSFTVPVPTLTDLGYKWLLGYYSFGVFLTSLMFLGFGMANKRINRNISVSSPVEFLLLSFLFGSLWGLWLPVRLVRMYKRKRILDRKRRAEKSARALVEIIS